MEVLVVGSRLWKCGGVREAWCGHNNDDGFQGWNVARRFKLAHPQGRAVGFDNDDGRESWMCFCGGGNDASCRLQDVRRAFAHALWEILPAVGDPARSLPWTPAIEQSFHVKCGERGLEGLLCNRNGRFDGDFLFRPEMDANMR